MSDWKAVAFATVAAAVVIAAACAPPEEERLEPFDTAEVGGAPDATADLSTDPIGPRPVEGLSGVLPSEFPRSAPLVTPSSLVDFGEDEKGRYILLVVGGSLAGVRDRQLGALHQAGWAVTGAGESYRATKGGEVLRLEFEDARGATEIRIAY